MKFKSLFRDREAVKRRRLAARALGEIRQIALVNYPLALVFDKQNVVERAAGESWPAAFGRFLGGLSLEQLRNFCTGILDSGSYQTSSTEEPTEKELHAFFLTWSALLVETEREISNASKLTGGSIDASQHCVASEQGS